jgi:chromosome segregation ATPase
MRDHRRRQAEQRQTSENDLVLQQQNIAALQEKLAEDATHIEQLERQVEAQRSRIDELEQEKRLLKAQHEQSQARITQLEVEHARLRAAAVTLLTFYDDLQYVKASMRADPGRYNFKLWLRTRGKGYAALPWAQRLLNDPYVPVSATEKEKNKKTKSSYAYSMRLSSRYSQEEMQEFEEAWEAMWWDEIFRKHYLTIRTTVESAIEEVQS